MAESRYQIERFFPESLFEFQEFEQEVEYAMASTRFSSRSRASDGGRDSGGANNNAFGTRNNTLNEALRGFG